jgi:hypothetical protein
LSGSAEKTSTWENARMRITLGPQRHDQFGRTHGDRGRILIG